MRSPTLDPTAGEQARAVREHPAMPQPVQDPTDPRYGLPDSREQTRDDRRILDPTDDQYGEPAI